MSQQDLFYSLFQTVYSELNNDLNIESTEQSLHITPNEDDVIAQYGNMVYRLAFARMQNRHDADDIFQEVFLRYVRRAPKFQSSEHAKAWFLRTTINCCKNYWASAWQRKTTGLSEVTDVPIVYENENVQLLADALAKLQPKYRMVLHLYYYEMMTAEEIARLQNIPAGTVRMQLSRGRNQLKALLLEGHGELFVEGGDQYDRPSI